MPVITFNAFSFLQKKLRENNIEYSNVSMTVDNGTKVKELIKQVKLNHKDVEVSFINGKIAPFDAILHHGDRIALIPPGTPGPYRVLLGFKNKKITECNKN